MELEPLLLGKMAQDEMDRLVSSKIKSFHGLLTKEAAMRLIAKDMGLLKEEETEYKLAMIPKDAKRICFRAKVRKVWPVAEYSSGKRSRVIEVADDGTSKPLVLWNDDVELGKSLRARDHILVRGCYERGGELHLGYSGTLEVVEKAGFTDLSAMEDGSSIHVSGFISKIEGFDMFVEGNRTRRGFSFLVSDGRSERRCVILDGADRGARLKEADDIIIENADAHDGRIVAGPDARILSRRKSAMLLGEVKRLGYADQKMDLEVGGRAVSLDRENALRLLGIKIADDIGLSSVIALKKGQILNRRMAVRIDEKDERIIVV